MPRIFAENVPFFTSNLLAMVLQLHVLKTLHHLFYGFLAILFCHQSRQLVYFVPIHLIEPTVFLAVARAVFLCPVGKAFQVAGVASVITASDTFIPIIPIEQEGKHDLVTVVVAFVVEERNQ